MVARQVLLTKQLSVVENQILDRKEKLLNFLLLLQRYQESRETVEVLDKKKNKQQTTERLKLLHHINFFRDHAVWNRSIQGSFIRSRLPGTTLLPSYPSRDNFPPFFAKFNLESGSRTRLGRRDNSGGRVVSPQQVG